MITAESTGRCLKNACTVLREILDEGTEIWVCMATSNKIRIRNLEDILAITILFIFGLKTEMAVPPSPEGWKSKTLLFQGAFSEDIRHSIALR